MTEKKKHILKLLMLLPLYFLLVFCFLLFFETSITYVIEILLKISEWLMVTGAKIYLVGHMPVATKANGPGGVIRLGLMPFFREGEGMIPKCESGNALFWEHELKDKRSCWPNSIPEKAQSTVLLMLLIWGSR